MYVWMFKNIASRWRFNHEHKRRSQWLTLWITFASSNSHPAICVLLNSARICATMVVVVPIVVLGSRIYSRNQSCFSAILVQPIAVFLASCLKAMHKRLNLVGEACPCGRLLTFNLEIICEFPGSDPGSSSTPANLTLTPGPAAERRRSRTRSTQRQLSQRDMSTSMTSMQMRQLTLTSTPMTPPGPPEERQPAATQERQPAATQKGEDCTHCSDTHPAVSSAGSGDAFPEPTTPQRAQSALVDELCSYCDDRVIDYRCGECRMTLCNQCAQPCPVQYERGCYQLYCPTHLHTHCCKSLFQNITERPARHQLPKQYRWTPCCRLWT